MAELYSQYASGAQFTAGPIVGSSAGISGANAIVDRLNSITSDAGAYSNLAPGEGINIGNGSVISCEYATTTNKGIANFNTNDFTVSTGAVSLKNKTTYWSASPFDMQQSDDSVNYTIDTTCTNIGLWTSGDNDWHKLYLPVHLPQGSVVTGAVVHGNTDSGTITWTLRRLAISGGTSGGSMASAVFDTEDTSISNATIDNENYNYYISFSSSSAVEALMNGARIKYTTDHD